MVKNTLEAVLICVILFPERVYLIKMGCISALLVGTANQITVAVLPSLMGHQLSGPFILMEERGQIVASLPLELRAL